MIHARMGGPHDGLGRVRREIVPADEAAVKNGPSDRFQIRLYPVNP